MALIEIERHQAGVAELVLNRPEKLNAFNPAMLEEFSGAVSVLAGDDSIRCVIIRGEGRAFSVGYDVDRPSATSGNGASTASPGPAAPNAAAEPSYTGHRPPYEDWRRLRRNLERWLAVWDLEKPVIAAVQGHCIGGATMLCVCTDITIVADDARIAWPSVPLGGGLLSPVSLWLTGMKRARELSYLVGSSFTGAEAVEMGWANSTVPAADLVTAARETAGRIARMPASLLRLKKLALNRVMETQGFRTAFLYGAEWDAIAHTTEENARMSAKIREVGLRDAIGWFDANGLVQ